MLTSAWIPSYPFTEAQAEAAYNEWGANCGPNALAFALGLTLDQVRHAIPDFESKRYTSPTMMKQGLAALGRKYIEFRPKGFQPKTFPQIAFDSAPCLVRIQWTGPWTQPGANPKWAYRQTHWICTFKYSGCDYVFDCNGGMTSASAWASNIAPVLTGLYPRADGGWFPTHLWRIQPC